MAKNIDHYRGDTKAITCTFTNTSGDAIDITGWMVFFTVKENRNDSDDDAVISKEVSSFADPTSGVAVIDLAPADTSALRPKSYYYDVQIKRDDGAIFTVVSGAFNLLHDITIRTVS